MKNLQTLENIRQLPAKLGMGHQIGSASDLSRKQLGEAFIPVRTAVVRALQHVDDSRRVCVQAGQLLRELKARCQHGEFLDLVEEFIPEISARTATTWMRAAESVTRALKFPDAIEVDSVITPLSEIIAGDDKKLSKEAKALKQLWFNFTEGKTIKDCIAGVVIDGDADSRIDRAINGKTKGGAGGDRKDFPRFIARHLRCVTSMLVIKKSGRPAKARALAADQRANIGAAFDGALKQWPRWTIEIISQTVRQELKLSDEQRTARQS